MSALAIMIFFLISLPPSHAPTGPDRDGRLRSAGGRYFFRRLPSALESFRWRSGSHRPAGDAAQFDTTAAPRADPPFADARLRDPSRLQRDPAAQDSRRIDRQPTARIPLH